jgi:TatD DNase family protein
MNPPFVDIHTHRRALDPSVEQVCTCLLGRGEPPPEGRFTAGVHPWEVEKTDFSVLDFFEENHPGLVGVGEIGLDFSRPDAERALQIQWLDQQLAIAERLGLPVVLHSVRANDEIWAELKKFRLKTVVFHGFTGSPELAEQWVKQGFYLSFNRRSLQSPRTVEALKTIPAENLFLETDDDPQARIEDIYGKAALLCGVPLETLKEKVFSNYELIIRNS